MFVSREHIDQMKAVIRALDHVTRLEDFQDLALGWAPAIASTSEGTLGAFFGYDFHLTIDGPKLIEVNTNAGGALLLLHVADAQQACCQAVENFVVRRFDISDLETEFVNMFRRELALQSPRADLRRVAIVDENPAEQYLGPEFALFKQMFEEHGIDADYIAQELVPPSERLLIVDGDEQSMKLDVRCYVYDSEIQLLGARLYRGQTTNFRTDGGGLAAVFTTPG